MGQPVLCGLGGRDLRRRSKGELRGGRDDEQGAGAHGGARAWGRG